MKNPEVETLRKIDALDVKIAKLRRELQEIPAELVKHKEQARKLAQRLEQVHEEQKRLKKEIDKLELEVKDNQEHIKKYQIQQNTAKTNEEYATLKRQIEALKRANSDLEDRELALYEKIDVAKAEEKAAREALEGGERKLKDEEAQAGKEIAEVEKEIEKLVAERAALEATVAPEILGTYKRVLEKLKNRALAPVHGRTCQGCFIEVPPNKVSQLLGGKDVVLCNSCSRILYLEDDYRAVTSTSFSVDEKTRDSTSKDGNW